MLRLTFYSGLTLTGFRTTRPRSVRKWITCLVQPVKCYFLSKKVPLCTSSKRPAQKKSTLQSNIGIHYLGNCCQILAFFRQGYGDSRKHTKGIFPQSQPGVLWAGAYLWFHEATVSNSPVPWIGCQSIVELPPSAFRSSVVTPMSTTHCSIG